MPQPVTPDHVAPTVGHFLFACYQPDLDVEEQCDSSVDTHRDHNRAEIIALVKLVQGVSEVEGIRLRTSLVMRGGWWPSSSRHQPIAARMYWHSVVGGNVMQVLSETERAIIEILARSPLTGFPPIHLPVVEKLSKQGVVCHQENHWYLTRVGLILAGQTLH